jgi:hypothetical protein
MRGMSRQAKKEEEKKRKEIKIAVAVVQITHPNGFDFSNTEES